MSAEAVSAVRPLFRVALAAAILPSTPKSRRKTGKKGGQGAYQSRDHERDAQESTDYRRYPGGVHQAVEVRGEVLRQVVDPGRAGAQEQEPEERREDRQDARAAPPAGAGAHRLDGAHPAGAQSRVEGRDGRHRDADGDRGGEREGGEGEICDLEQEGPAEKVDEPLRHAVAEEHPENGAEEAQDERLGYDGTCDHGARRA